MQGKIVKGIAGFYYVYVAGSGLYECKARGIFRKEGLKPLTGDLAELEDLGSCSETGYKEGSVRRILERKNTLIRPAVANIDGAVLVMACASPEPNGGLLDRFLVMMERQKVPVAIVLNKTDLAPETGEEFRRIYEAFPFFSVSVAENRGLTELWKFLHGKTVTVAGPSGVGKSSLINALCGTAVMETGQISAKIDRGRHTTRHSELIMLDEETFICDTPGFTSLYLPEMPAAELQKCYPELRPYLHNCYFEDCMHVSEPDCCVREAAAKGRFPIERYNSYCELYKELKERKVVYR